MKRGVWGAVAVALAASATVQGATHTWTGNGASPNWSDPGNWLGGIPANDPAGLHLVFNDDATGTHTMTQDVPGLQVASMTFDTFDGDPYVLTGIGFTMSGSVASHGEDHDVYVPIVLGADLTVGTNFQLGGVRLLGPISGDHGIQVGGFLTLGGDNDFTGPVNVVNGGGVTVRHSHALGTPRAGTSVVGRLRFEDYVYDPTRVESITVAGAGPSLSPMVEAAGTNVVENLTLGASPFGVGVNLVPGSRLDIIRLISVPAPIQLRAPSATLRLLGPSSFGHQLEVREGTLVVNGAMPAAAIRLDSALLPPAPPTRLSGSGTIAGLRVVNGDVAPGDPLGILTVNGDLLFFGASSLHIELAPVPDRVVVTGLVDLANASLLVTRSFLPPLGTVFTVMTHNGNLTGQFAGLPNGATLQVLGQSYRIDYLATAITLTALDELPVTLETFRVE